MQLFKNTWEAQNICWSMGMDLFVIDSKYTQNDLLAYVRDNIGYAGNLFVAGYSDDNAVWWTSQNNRLYCETSWVNGDKNVKNKCLATGYYWSWWNKIYGLQAWDCSTPIWFLCQY